MHWEENEELRNWFKELLSTLDINFIKAEARTTDEIPDKILSGISPSGIFIAVLTFPGEKNRTWVDNEIAVARN
jgi:hypothetical protein